MSGSETGAWPCGEGEMVRRIREHDWPGTPLGPIDAWPASLRGAVQMILDHPFPMVLGWGPELITIYNDAYRPLLGNKPEALGRPYLDVWREAHDTIEPQIARALAGEKLFFESVPFTLVRGVEPQEAFFDYSFSPLRDDAKKVAGMLNTAVEITERVVAERRGAEAERALRASERRLRNILDGMDEAFGLLDHDLRIVSQNQAALRLDGRALEDIRGRTHWEVYPGSEESELGRLYKRGLAEQVPVALEHRYEFPDGSVKWLDMRAYPVPEGLAVFWRDITERKAGEEALRESEERQRFLLELSDALRPVSDAGAMMGLACHKLAAVMGASRVNYAEVEGEDYVVRQEYRGPGFPSMAGRYRIDSFRPDERKAFEAGRTVAISDIREEMTEEEAAAYTGLGVGGFVSVPLVKAGRLVAVLGIIRTEPRPWTQGEISLAQETAERTWAAVERARAEAALRASEERYRLLFDSIDEGFCVIEVEFDEMGKAVDYRFLEVNASFEQQTGLIDAVGKSMRSLAPDHEEHWFEIYGRIASTGVPARFERAADVLGHYYEVYAFRIGEPVERKVGILFNDIMERKKSEAALRESEERYRALFESMDEAYAVVEVIRSADGGWKDFLFLEVNPAFMEHTGMPYPVGKTATQLLGTPNPRWAQIYGEVAETGQPVRIEEGEAMLGRIFSLNIFRLGGAGSRRVAVLFTDITQQKKAEAALRESEERQAFLLELSDALRVLTDPDDITATATRLLGERLGASRAYYVEWPAGENYGQVAQDYTAPGVASLAGRYPVDVFRSAYDRISQGRTWIVEDANTDSEMDAEERQFYIDSGVVAWIDVPLLKGGQVRSALCLVQDAPRTWSEADIALTEETAERCWAAIERGMAEAALRESEARFRIIADANLIGVGFGDSKGNVSYLNDEMLRMMGRGRAELDAGRVNFLDQMDPEDLDSATETAERLRRDGYHIGYQRRFLKPDGTYTPYAGAAALLSADGDQHVSLALDLTRIEAAEAAVRASEERIRQFGEASTDVLWIREAESLRWEYLTPAFETIYGMTAEKALADGQVEEWFDIILPEDRERVRDRIEHVRAGERTTFEFRIRRVSDGQVRWLRETDFPIRDANGRVKSIGGIGQDVTEEKEMSGRLEVMVAELQHRTRNLLGLVRSMADRTMSNSEGLDDFKHRFRERLGALARANGLLSRLDGGQKVTFDALLRSELQAVGAVDREGYGRQVTMEGPSGVRLRSTSVQTFAMALHELITNACKHGALATEDGHLTIEWRMVEKEGGIYLHLEWRESGFASEAARKPPQGGGFGRELIEKALPYQFDARTMHTFTEDGVRCTIDLPISARQEAMSHG